MIDVDVPALLDELGIAYERRGYELWAPCPFPDHPDADPSWHIEDRPGGEKHAFHRCFGCKQGGGAVGLVKQVLELQGEDAGKRAYQWMRECGVVGDRVGSLPHRVRLVGTKRSIVNECRIPRGVSLDVALEDWPTPIRRYAMRPDRGITAEQVARWGIGYAVQGRMRGRIVFVARDRRGKVLRYNGRTMGKQKPKYLGPRRGQWWDRSAVFGELHWPEPRSLVVVAEGEFNALACERVASAIPKAGIAALAGSELLDPQINKLSTFEQLIVVSDPDRAGNELWEKLRKGLGRWANLSRAMISKQDGDAAKMPARRLAEVLKHAV